MNAAASPTTALPPATVRRNFWCLSLEGGAYMGGKAIINADTIVPTLVSRLGGSPWLVALTPALLLIGFMLPQLTSIARLAIPATMTSLLWFCFMVFLL